MVNTCKDCKHWTRSSGSYSEIYSGNCDSDKFIEASAGVKIPKDGLEYWDYEGYSAGFSTGEDFGCIHWENR
jgi:hypothetical protein